MGGGRVRGTGAVRSLQRLAGCKSVGGHAAREDVTLSVNIPRDTIELVGLHEISGGKGEASYQRQ